MYRIIGEDGRQYGPIVADDLRRWIAEGRANAQTLVHLEGAAEWKPLGTLPEFAAYFTQQQRPPAISPVSGSHNRQTNGFALWGMILGIISVVGCFCCCLNIPLGVLGLIFSLVGLLQTNERPEIYEGRGLAIAGIVLSALGLLIGLGLMLSGTLNGHHNPHYYYNWHLQR